MHNNIILLSKKEVAPADIIDGVRSLDPKSVCTSTGFKSDWPSILRHLEWAHRDFEQGDDRGYINSIGHAKRAACQVIDSQIRNNHLYVFESSKYPEKLVALNDIGISIPDIVHDLVITPRNQLEHQYQIPDKRIAKIAIGVAELTIRAIKCEERLGTIVSINFNINYSHFGGPAGEKVEFKGFYGDPILFVDIFEEPHLVKIIFPKEREVVVSKLCNFNKTDSTELARLLRDYSLRVDGIRGNNAFFYTEIKRQGGF